MVAFALIAISVTIFTQKIEGDLFSSSVDIERVTASIARVPELVDKYVAMEIERLQLLKESAQQFLNVYAQNAQFFTQDALHNPTSAYLIVKLLATYWNPVEHLIKQNIGENYLKEAVSGAKSQPFTLPNVDDVTGLSKALMILQTIYELDTHSIADGILPGGSSTVVMKARDCYDIGRIAYEKKDYFHTILWMQEAIERAEREMPGATITEGEALEYLGFCTGELGDIPLALELTQKLLALVPSHPTAPQNIAYYQSVLNKSMENNSQSVADDKISAKARKYGSALSDINTSSDHYAALCRGDIIKTEEENSKLFCHYKDDTPFLKLARLKVEILLLNPIMRLFRQVISDNEIEVVTKISSPKLFRSLVVDRYGNGSELSEYRVSKNAWLHDSEDPIAEGITRRVKDMTNLDMETAEQFQVANYGIGGHYQPHVDMLFADADGQPDLEISQPQAGGATVFPELNLTLFPSKHDAIFWYNYFPGGKPDMRMRHSGCPVLVGTKWILNKWIHERGQEFNRPCLLDELGY